MPDALGFRGKDERGDGAVANLAQEVSYLWRTVPCPVIAAVHGVCIGGVCIGGRRHPTASALAAVSGSRVDGS